MDTRGHVSPLVWGKLIRERDKIVGMCLIIGGKSVCVKLDCGVMQKIPVGAVC